MGDLKTIDEASFFFNHKANELFQSEGTKQNLFKSIQKHRENEFLEAYAQRFEQVKNKTNIELAELFRDLITNYLGTLDAKNKNLVHPIYQAIINYITKTTWSVTSKKNFETTMTSLSNIRNTYIAHNIYKEYCNHLSQNTLKPFFIKIGKNHTEDLKKKLEHRFEKTIDVINISSQDSTGFKRLMQN